MYARTPIGATGAPVDLADLFQQYLIGPCTSTELATTPGVVSAARNFAQLTQRCYREPFPVPFDVSIGFTFPSERNRRAFFDKSFST